MLSLVFTSLSVFAQFTNRPEVNAAFDPDGQVWVKVMFLNGSGPDNVKYLTDNFGYGFRAMNEFSGDSPYQLFQLVGTDLNSFQLVSKKGTYLNAGIDQYSGNLSINNSNAPNQGSYYNLKVIPAKAGDEQGYNGIATKRISFVDTPKLLVPQYTNLEWEGYINPEDNNDGVVLVFKVIGADPPPSDPAPEDPQETTYKLTKVTNGNGTFKICKKGTTEEIADLDKVEENTQIDIVCTPESGHVLKQINGGDLFDDAFSTFDEQNGQATTYSVPVAVTKNATITVTFVEKVVEKQKFMLLRSYGSDPAGGTFKVYNSADNQEIPEGTKVEEGTTVYVKAIPEDGYILKQVKVAGQTSGQGELFSEANFDPKTGFDLTVNGINPITENTRITVTFVKKQEEEQPEEEVKTPEGFTNAPFVASEFDASAKTWYKIYFVNKSQPDKYKVLTTKGEGAGLKAEDDHADDDNQLWQLVGTDRNEFQLVSKSGMYLYSKVGTTSIDLNSSATPQKDQYKLKLVKPEDFDLQTYKGAPTKMLKFIDRDYYDFIYPQSGIIDEDKWVETTTLGYNGGAVVVFKQIGEDPKPVEMVSVTIQCAEHQGTATVEGDTQTPITISDQEKIWSLESGKEYTLNIVPKKGWEFDYLWDNRYTNVKDKKFTASNENPRIEVHFKEKKYPIQLYTKVDGGAIQVTNHWIETASLGQEMQLKAIPDAGYILEYVKVRGEDITGTMKFLIGEDNAIEASFVKKTTGTVHSFTGTGGSVTLEGHNDGDEVDLGQKVKLIVTPETGYELSELMVGGQDVKATKEFTVSDNNTIEAVFVKKTYTLTVPTVSGGKLTLKDVADGAEVEFGTTVTVEVAPETGYELATLTVGGKDIKDARTFEVSENNEILASFKKKMFPINLPTSNQGTLEFDGYENGAMVEYGTIVAIKVMPKKGYMLESLVVGEKDVTADQKFTVGENNTIVVEFTEKLYALVAPVVNGGRIEFLGINEGDKLKMGTKVRVKVTPEKGYVLDKLTVGGKDITADRILTVGDNNDIVVVFKKANALDEIDGFSFAVYPNPATEFVKVEGLVANAQVKVFSLTGKLVLSAQADYAGAVQLNVSQLPEGLYLVRSGKVVVKLQVK